MVNKIVTEALKARVWAKLHQGMRIIQDRYGIVMNDPVIDYDLTGSTAGWAFYKEWRISFNAGLLNEHTEAFLARTVPHELAHLATERIYPEAHETSDSRKKREPHGPKWQEIMGVLGADPKRTHSYDITNVAKPKTKYHYVCPCCKHSYVLGPKQHAKAQQNPNAYACAQTACHERMGRKASIIFEQSLGRVTYGQTRGINSGNIIKGPDAKYELKLKVPTGNSKMAKCWDLYQCYFDRYDRHFIIEMFVLEADCTSAGAATYYSNCKKLYEAGV